MARIGPPGETYVNPPSRCWLRLCGIKQGRRTGHPTDTILGAFCVKTKSPARLINPRWTNLKGLASDEPTSVSAVSNSSNAFAAIFPLGSIRLEGVAASGADLKTSSNPLRALIVMERMTPSRLQALHVKFLPKVARASPERKSNRAATIEKNPASAYNLQNLAFAGHYNVARVV